MKAILFLLISSFAGVVVFSQARFLIPYREGDRWGFADSNQTIVVKPIYKEVGFFQSGHAFVTKDSVYEVIDSKGNLLIAPLYEKIHFVGSENAIVEKGGKVGIVSLRSGRLALPVIYAEIRPFDFERFYMIRKTGAGWGLYDLKKKKLLIPAKYRDFHFDSTGVEKNYYSFIATKDSFFFSLSQQQEFRKEKQFIKKEIPASLPAEQEMPAVLEELTVDGNHVVTTSSWPVIQNGKQGWLYSESSDAGEKSYSIPPIYDSISRIAGADSLFIVQKDGTAGVISWTNRILLPFQYEEIQAVDSSVMHGIYIVKSGGKFGLANMEKEILPCIYDGISWVSYDFGAFILNKDGKSGAYIFDNKRKIYHVFIPAVYDIFWGLRSIQAADFDSSIPYDWNKGYFKFLVEVTSNGKRGYVDLQGRKFFRD